ncbi:hypothetical protein [Pantoea vagans]|nr:hypothetical protein [Pantoea vagans]
MKRLPQILSAAFTGGFRPLFRQYDEKVNVNASPLAAKHTIADREHKPAI